jgi:hypothetical protein
VGGGGPPGVRSDENDSDIDHYHEYIYDKPSNYLAPERHLLIHLSQRHRHKIKLVLNIDVIVSTNIYSTRLDHFVTMCFTNVFGH